MSSLQKNAPTKFFDTLRYLGPGLIITASIVGSGELIVTPKLGAEVGMTLLWFIILGCIMKVFVQIELGRYAISKGVTTLEAMDRIPGPRLRVSWLVWLWLFMYAALVFQVAGIMSGAGEIFFQTGLAGSKRFWMIIVAISCAVILFLGRYRVVEKVSTVMVAAFTIFTLFAVGALPWTPYEVSSADIFEGLSFGMPDNFTTAFAAFGIIGVGASELVYYPYWCLEKGYARFVGNRDGDWLIRARGWLRVMRIDAWVSMVIYTLATVAFYVLGAAVLHGKGLEVTDQKMIGTLSQMYQATFGVWGLLIFLVGAFMVLYSTAFVATASNARLFADALSVFKFVRYETPESRMRVVRWSCVFLPAVSVLLYLMVERPVTLVFIGALAQGIMLPFLALAACYFRFYDTERDLRPGKVWTLFLLIATLSMVTVGTYQVVTALQAKLKPAAVAPAQGVTVPPQTTGSDQDDSGA